MTGRAALAALCSLGMFGLAGCSATIGLYHSAEGGAIAKSRQPPPGANAPYPNLAAVPATPVAPSQLSEAVAGQRLAGGAGSGGVSEPSPQALAGLTLPGEPPPAPVVPDITIPKPSLMVSQAAPVAVAAALKLVPPPSTPVSLAFAPRSALLDPDTVVALRGVAAATGGGTLLVGGFGEAGGVPDQQALILALARAQRLADALTADGVPAAAIRLVAMAGGSGGFVQLIY